MARATDADFDLSWTSSSTSTGEGDVYAEITVDGAELSTNGGDAAWSWDTGDVSAKIVSGDVTVILGSPDGLGNASSPDMDQDEDTDGEDTVAPGFGDGEGLEVQYMDASVGIDWFYTAATDTFEYLVYGAYGMDVTEELSADVAFAVNEGDIYGTVMAAYAMDDYSVEAAFDMQNEGSFAWDASVAASATVEDVTVDLGAYYDGDLDVFGKVSYAMDALDVSLAGYLNDSSVADVDDNDDDTETLDAWSLDFDASYALDDVYTPYLSVGYNASETLPVEVGVDAALIDNASVNLNYATDDMSDAANNKGTVTASVTVSL